MKFVKLKYYLRGLGIGIIVTTLILMISFSRREVSISDEEVMARAAQLGMVMAETETLETETQEPETQQPETQQAETQQMETQQIETQQPETQQAEIQQPETPVAEPDVPDTTTPYRLTIQSGDVCRIVCENLASNGVVADAEALRKHLFELGYASSLSTGEYDVPYGLTMEEVAQILIAGPIQ